MRQETLTVVARVKDAEAVARALADVTADCPDGPCKPSLFGAPELGIHFARFVLLHEDPDASPLLVFESNFDTSHVECALAQSAHLALLVERVGARLFEIFQHCQDFSERARFVDDLTSQLQPASAAYQGHTERDLGRIRLEQHLREVLLTYLESAPKQAMTALYAKLHEHVRRLTFVEPRLAGLDLTRPAPPQPSSAVRSQRLTEGYGPWLANALPVLPVLRHFLGILSWPFSDPEYDQRGKQEAWTDVDRQRFRDLSANEDHGMQNALTHVVPLKLGRARLFVLRHAHAYIDRMAKRHFDDIGQLGGIPTIHFAKWLLLEDGKRLLFFSNYDSSWESYLGDFVDQAAIGLNLAWTSTDAYPRTFFLMAGGAKDEERFKAWSRAHQRPTQVFYAAYPELSIAALNNNSWIRDGLHHPPPAGELSAWFRRLT
ncbi:MAG TPA: hypothetical protein VGI10_08785 [Polyangiaceae bacterium]